MDPFTAMMSMEDLPEEQLRALANQLRGTAATGGQLSTSTIEPVQQQAKLMQLQSNDQAQRIGLQNAKKAELEERKAQREANRLEKAMDRQARLMAASMKAKGDKGYKLSDTAAKKFRDRAETIGVIRDLSNSFEDDYAGSIPFLGEAENWLANKGVGTDKQKGQSEWWGNWKKFYENIERNRLFGSALTDSEQRQWRASNITPDMEAGQIRSRLKVLNDLSQKAAAFEAKDLTLRGHGEYAQEMMEAQGILPRSAFDDLDSFMEQKSTAVSKGAYPNKAGEFDGMSDEELLRMLGGSQ